jgi:hypothetical protein
MARGNKECDLDQWEFSENYDFFTCHNHVLGVCGMGTNRLLHVAAVVPIVRPFSVLNDTGPNELHLPKASLAPFQTPAVSSETPSDHHRRRLRRCPVLVSLTASARAPLAEGASGGITRAFHKCCVFPRASKCICEMAPWLHGSRGTNVPIWDKVTAVRMALFYVG